MPSRYSRGVQCSWSSHIFSPCVTVRDEKKKKKKKKEQLTDAEQKSLNPLMHASLKSTLNLFKVLFGWKIKNEYWGWGVGWGKGLGVARGGLLFCTGVTGPTKTCQNNTNETQPV